MRSISTLSILLYATQLVCVAQTPAERPQRRSQVPKVYVWTFQSNIRDRELIESITDEFETAVVKTKRFDVLERRSLARLLKQQDAEASTVLNLNIVDRETLRAKGAQAVFFGKVFNDAASGHLRITVTLESFDTSILWKSDVLMRPPELRDADIRGKKLESLLASAALVGMPSASGAAHPTETAHMPFWDPQGHGLGDHAIGLYRCRIDEDIIVCVFALTRLSTGSLDYTYDPRDRNFSSKLIDDFKIEHKQISGYFLNGRGQQERAINLAKDDTVQFVQEFAGAASDLKRVRILFTDSRAELHGSIE